MNCDAMMKLYARTSELSLTPILEVRGDEDFYGVCIIKDDGAPPIILERGRKKLIVLEPDSEVVDLLVWFGTEEIYRMGTDRLLILYQATSPVIHHCLCDRRH